LAQITSDGFSYYGFDTHTYGVAIGCQRFLNLNQQHLYFLGFATFPLAVGCQAIIW